MLDSEMQKNRKLKKPRDPYWRLRRFLGKRIVPSLKGRGSYNRKKGNKDVELD